MNELEWNVTAGERPPAYNPTNKRKEEIQLNSIDIITVIKGIKQ